jgi:penicillin G amidase
MRMVVDLSDLDNSRAIHTTGQSGHPYHRHYTDLIDDWSAGRFHPMRPPPDRMADRLRLLPD